MPATPPTTPPTIAPVWSDGLVDGGAECEAEEDGDAVDDANIEDIELYAGFVETTFRLSSQTPRFSLQHSPYSSDPRIPQHRLPSSHCVTK
jgi:hypothetical protein